MSDAIELMTANLKRPLPLTVIAGRLGLSITHFGYLFKKETGQSPSQYLMTLRLKRAGELLLKSSQSVKEIMNAVGFGDKSNFNRAFKKFYGDSPSAYRQRNRNLRNRKFD